MKKITIPIRFGKIKGLCWGKGNSKKILALHGWLDNAASFSELAPMLAKEGYEVIAIDFAGHGKSDHRAEGHFSHFGDFVLDIHGVLEQLEWDKCTLLGHSMGAAMAVMYSVAYKEHIEKLIMIENLGPVPAYEQGTAASNLRKALSQWQTHNTKHQRFYQSIDSALQVRHKATPMAHKILRPLVKRSLKKSKKGYHWRTDKRLKLRSMVRFSEELVQDILTSEKPPTQLILAEPPTYALSYPSIKERIKKLNAENVIKIKGHHHLHMDKAGEVCRAVIGFLDE